MSVYDEADKKFQREITDDLVQRYFINVNKQVGTAHLDAIHEDLINPCVTITRDDIAYATGRDIVRDVVLEDYAKAMRNPSIEVTENLENKTLRICIAPVRSPDIDFKSLKAMRAKNEKELEDDPELAKDPFADLR